MDTLHAEIVTFIKSYVRSLDDLEVLMLCVDAGDRWWDAAGIARATGLKEGAARRALDQLTRGNLLDIRITGDVRYAFSPGTAALRDAAVACAAAYRSRPVAVITCVTAAPRGLRDFADAFRIRRDDGG